MFSEEDANRMIFQEDGARLKVQDVHVPACAQEVIEAITSRQASL